MPKTCEAATERIAIASVRFMSLAAVAESESVPFRRESAAKFRWFPSQGKSPIQFDSTIKRKSVPTSGRNLWTFAISGHLIEITEQKFEKRLEGVLEFSRDFCHMKPHKQRKQKR